MTYERAQLSAALDDWEARMSGFSLPSWEELPNIDLYMDQVVTFLTQELGPYLSDKPMTASTINNYVRTGVMPAPKKKRYTRLHMAFLIMICTLRQSMSIAAIQQIISVDLSEEDLRDLYQRYVQQHSDATRFFITHLRPVITPEQSSPLGEMTWLVASSAVLSALSKMLTEHLLTLHDAMLQPEAEKPSASRKAGGKEKK